MQKIARFPAAPIALLMGICVFSGCSTVRTIVKVTSESKAIVNDIEKKLGERPRTHFRITNGRVTQVTVTFAAGKIKDRSVADVEAVVRNAVCKHMKEKPDRIVVSFVMALASHTAAGNSRPDGS